MVKKNFLGSLKFDCDTLILIFITFASIYVLYTVCNGSDTIIEGSTGGPGPGPYYSCVKGTDGEEKVGYTNRMPPSGSQVCTESGGKPIGGEWCDEGGTVEELIECLDKVDEGLINLGQEEKERIISAKDQIQGRLNNTVREKRERELDILSDRQYYPSYPRSTNPNHIGECSNIKDEYSHREADAKEICDKSYTCPDRALKEHSCSGQFFKPCRWDDRTRTFKNVNSKSFIHSSVFHALGGNGDAPNGKPLKKINGNPHHLPFCPEDPSPAWQWVMSHTGNIRTPAGCICRNGRSGNPFKGSHGKWVLRCNKG